MREYYKYYSSFTPPYAWFIDQNTCIFYCDYSEKLLCVANVVFQDLASCF